MTLCIKVVKNIVTKEHNDSMTMIMKLTSVYLMFWSWCFDSMCIYGWQLH